MLKEFVEKIQSLAFTKVEIDGRTLTTSKLYEVLDPMPEPLDLHTLQGLVDMQKRAEIQSLDSKCFIHVQSYDRAKLVGEICGKEMQRRVYADSKAYPYDHNLSNNLPLDEFLIYIQSSFVQDETTAKILRVLGNLVQGSETEFADDGMTQRVTARSGVTRREVVDLPNPVELRPFRTFPEIEQPLSKFVLRIKGGNDGEQPWCMLAEADGGGWKDECVANIKQFFVDAGVPVVG